MVKGDREPERLLFLDGLRAFAMIAVALGHAVSELWGEDVFVFQFIYSFHMPLLFMVSGLTWSVVKGKSEAYLTESSARLLMTSGIFAVINMCMAVFYEGLRIADALVYAYNGVWFIIVLAIIQTAVCLQSHLDRDMNKMRAGADRRLDIMLVFAAVLVMMITGGYQVINLSKADAFAFRLAGEVSKLSGYYLCYLYADRFRETGTNVVKGLLLNAVGVLLVVVCYHHNIMVNVGPVRIIAGFLIAPALIGVFENHYKKNILYTVSVFSLEIYLTHVLVMRLLPDSINPAWYKCLLLTLIFLMSGVIMGYAEKYIPILRTIFHPVIKRRHGR